MSDLTDDRRRSVPRRSSSSCAEDRRLHSRGADNVCVTVNTPRTDDIGAVGSPSPAGRNDLRNVLHLAERDGDDWGSESCSEDDESSAASGSDSDFLSDSYAHEDDGDDSLGALKVIISEKLRQLATSTRAVSTADADAVQSAPEVEGVNPPTISVSHDGDDWMVRTDACEENSVEVVRSGDDQTADGVDADVLDAGPTGGPADECSNPSAIGVSQDADKWLPGTDTFQEDSAENVRSGVDETVGIVDADVLDAGPMGYETLNHELEMHESTARVVKEGEGQDQLPADASDDDSVEKAETASGDNATGLTLTSSASEELAAELGSSADRDDSLDGTQLYDADKSVLSPCLSENADGVIGPEISTDSTVAVWSDLGSISDASSGTLPSNYVKQRAMECERLLSDNAGPGPDAMPTQSDAPIARVDSVEGGMSKLPTSSDSLESNMEKSVANAQVRVIVTAAEECSSSAYYSDAELDALIAADEDSEGISQRRDSFGSIEGDLWPAGRVFRLARQYSGRVKEMNASPAAFPRRRFLAPGHKSADESSSNDDLASFSEQSQFLPSGKDEDTTTMPAAQFYPSGRPSRHGKSSRGNSRRTRVRSVDESATFPQTNVRDTIRKLKQKGLASNVAYARHQSEFVYSTSESFHMPGSSTEDDPEQFTDSSASQKPLRHPGSLVQERLRMLHGGGDCC